LWHFGLFLKQFFYIFTTISFKAPLAVAILKSKSGLIYHYFGIFSAWLLFQRLANLIPIRTGHAPVDIFTRATNIFTPANIGQA
jgi:hypothetical protein